MNEKCVLITTDGYEISYELFPSRDVARREMLERYTGDIEDVTGDFKDLSTCSDDFAIVYDNGHSVYVYQLYLQSELFGPAEPEVQNLMENVYEITRFVDAQAANGRFDKTPLLFEAEQFRSITSVEEDIKNQILQWAKEFETLYADTLDYLDKITSFTEKKMREIGWLNGFQRWAVTTWNEEDLINALQFYNLPANRKNIKRAKKACKDLFNDTSDGAEKISNAIAWEFEKEISSLEERKSGKHYAMLVTQEDERYEKMEVGLDYFMDNPHEGEFVAYVEGDSFDELVGQGDFEGLFFQLYDKHIGKRISRGVIDPDSPREEIEEYESSHLPASSSKQTSQSVSHKEASDAISKCLTLSTAHVTKNTMSRLEREGQSKDSDLPVNYPKDEFGFWIYCGDIVSSYGGKNNIPEDLWNCMLFAHDHDCDWLCLDRDGEQLRKLVIYDWSDEL